MISMTSHQLVTLFGGQQNVEADFTFTGVEIDSRNDCSNTLFIAIKGENFDGHDFVSTAAEKGAVAALVERRLDVAIPQIVVKNCRKSLGLLANAWRKQLNPVVIAITGSNGKTTVKEMLGRILASQFQCIQTSGNLNNDIGVPLTLFRLSADDRYAVIEMGANHGDEIRQLVGIAEPDVVYVNNARAAHVEGFGSLEAVVQAKGEMYQYSSPQAIAVFNEDESAVEQWKLVCKAQKNISFSTQVEAHVTASYKNTIKGLQVTFSYLGQQEPCTIQMQGAHNAQNALAAVTLALACDLSLQQAANGLEGIGGVKGRLEFRHGIQGSLIIDDSYNANPDSLAAAVKVLCSFEGTPWLALGDMAELGADSQDLHDRAVQDSWDAGIKQLFALGEESCKAATISAENSVCFDSHDDMANYLSSRLTSDINLLIKGSRSAHMEKLVDRLVSDKPVDDLMRRRNVI
jgi:UDP-N-acetylmuramoyl-tripeptide--D-alanyl-D-alanine ligase